MFTSGYRTIGRFRGIPIRVHWSAPLGALIIGGLNFVPGFWLGFLAIILAHEVGHAYLVRRRGLYAQEIMMHAVGGYCRHQSGSPLDNAIIAWGGVLAQAMILIPSFILSQLGLWPDGRFGADLAQAFVRINLMIMALNLLPLPGFDGALAWKFFGLWKADRARKGGLAKTKKRRANPNGLRVVRDEDDDPPKWLH